jgi:phospholipid N-methyltransferase
VKTTHPRDERRLFLEQWRRNFTTTGAIMASSRGLARAMTANIRPGDAPQRILEAGPGTGVFTEEIARRMGPHDRLDIYEINAAFASYIERRIEQDPAFAGLEGRIHLHRTDILDLPADATFDRIVSSLPLNNFEPSSVRRIFDTFFAHLSPGGILSYFEYAFVRTLKSWVSGGPERRRLRGVDRVTAEYLQQFQVRSDPVVLNLPPAVARHLVKPVALELPSPRMPAGLRPAAVVR